APPGGAIGSARSAPHRRPYTVPPGSSPFRCGPESRGASRPPAAPRPSVAFSYSRTPFTSSGYTRLRRHGNLEAAGNVFARPRIEESETHRRHFFVDLQPYAEEVFHEPARRVVRHLAI